MTSLLEKAKNFKPTRSITREIYSKEALEVVVAWLKRDISTQQMTVALQEPERKTYGGGVVYKAAVILRMAVQSGDVQIKIKR